MYAGDPSVPASMDELQQTNLISFRQYPPSIPGPQCRRGKTLLISAFSIHQWEMRKASQRCLVFIFELNEFCVTVWLMTTETTLYLHFHFTARIKCNSGPQKLKKVRFIKFDISPIKIVAFWKKLFEMPCQFSFIFQYIVNSKPTIFNFPL